ncbi:MAG: D-glycero-beta-D-manno-heptose 1-phosphate adenylyltransferase [Pirellulaceae bacterium]
MIQVRPECWDAVSQLRVLVIGDAMLDSYFHGSSRRLCQEAPVPVVDVNRRCDMPGGAANCAANLAAMGTSVSLVGVLGGDPDGEVLRDRLRGAGVATDRLVVCPERRTLSKSRIICDDHMLVRFDGGSTDSIDGAAQQAILGNLEKGFLQADAVIVSDYGYGVLAPAVIDRLAQLQAATPKVLVVDSKHLAAYRHVGMTACKPNFRETRALLGLPEATAGHRRCETLLEHGDRLIEATGSRIAAVTLDCDGAIIFEAGQPPHRTCAQSAPQNRAAGAGDTFLSTLAVALAAGLEAPAAAEWAAAAAAVVVSKMYTATCSLEELRSYMAGRQRPESRLTALLPMLEEYRRQKRRIVLTNGCFDILHRGHISYLGQARRLGDVLIVGVNTDESIRRLKGQNRPINCLADRIGVLAGLASVDHVVVFDEDTPHRLIEAVRPDVFVKGGDYTRASLPEATLVERLGGTVKIIPFISDRSTTGIIQRICRAYGTWSDGAGRISQGIDHDSRSLAAGSTPVVR